MRGGTPLKNIITVGSFNKTTLTIVQARTYQEFSNGTRIMFSKKRGDAPGGSMAVIMFITISIMLSSGVVLYGTSLFQVEAQQESFTVTGMKVWTYGSVSDSLSWGAFSVRNTGDKVLSIDRIVARGIDVPFAQWYPDNSVTIDMIQQPMNFTGWSNNNGFLKNDVSANCSPSTTIRLVLQPSANPTSSGWFCANAAAGPIVLDPSQAAIIYFRLNNGTISGIDGGATANVSVFAGKMGTTQSIAIASKT